MTKNVDFATFTQTVMIRTVLLITGSLLNIEYSWIWDKYSLFTDGPYYHWLNSVSRVLISTRYAPLVQTGECKQFSLFDLDLWPNPWPTPQASKVKIYSHAEYQGQRSNGSTRRAPSAHRQTEGHTDASKRFIAPATRSINWPCRQNLSSSL